MKFSVAKPISEVDASHVVPYSPPVDYCPIDRPLALPSALSEPLDEEIYKLLVDDIKDAGFREGAVVVAKRIAPCNRVDPYNWGFVVGFERPQMQGANPIKVKWASGSMERCREDELRLVYSPHWADKHILEALLSDIPAAQRPADAA